MPPPFFIGLRNRTIARERLGWIPVVTGMRDEGWLRRAGLKSSIQKSDLSENWAFWIPAPVSEHEGRLFAGMTELGPYFML